MPSIKPLKSTISVLVEAQVGEIPKAIKSGKVPVQKAETVFKPGKANLKSHPSDSFNGKPLILKEKKDWKCLILWDKW